MRKLLQLILKILSKAVIKKYDPVVIGITGSVGKTSTKEAVFAVLKNKFRVRRSVGSFNTEEGIAVNILTDWNEEDLKLISKFGPTGRKIRKAFLWFRILISGFLNFLFLPKSKYPEILVLEYGADRPGDLDRLIDIAKPKIGIVTAVGELPVHLEFYSSPLEVAEEKSKLIQKLPKDGLAILNRDDRAVFDMKDIGQAKTVTFGFSPDSTVRASDTSYFIDNGHSEKSSAGLSFKVNYENTVIPFRLANALGRHQIYAALAAAAVGLHFHINLVEISQALEGFEFPKQRMKLLAGIKNSYIIDDYYNASPLSTQAALDALKEFGDRGILALMCDSTDAEKEGHSPSEQTIYENMDLIFQQSPGMIIVGTL